MSVKRRHNSHFSLPQDTIQIFVVTSHPRIRVSAKRHFLAAFQRIKYSNCFAKKIKIKKIHYAFIVSGHFFFFFSFFYIHILYSNGLEDLLSFLAINRGGFSNSCCFYRIVSCNKLNSSPRNTGNRVQTFTSSYFVLKFFKVKDQIAANRMYMY